MFNIQRELEIANANWQIVSIHDNGSYLEVRIRDTDSYETTYAFNRITGVFDGHERRDTSIIRLRAKSEMVSKTEFHLVAGKRDWGRDDWLRINGQVFTDGKIGSDIAREHSAKARDTGTDWTFAIRKHVELSPLADYVQWADERFSTGEWTQLPWANEPWVKPELNHFAHVSCANEFQVAFWESVAHAQADHVTVMAPGRYLQRYYADVLSSTAIRDWSVKLDTECELTIYTGPDDIAAAYVEAGTGCMRYPDDGICHDGVMWRSGQNPTRVYGAGDLGVALLRRNGYCIGRALVWPAKKAVGRIYGDIERMRDVLENEGWQFDSTGHSADSRGQGLLNGARLLKIRPEGRDGNFMMPYLDLGYRVDHHDDEHFELSLSGVHYAHCTDGLLFAPDNRDDECDDEDYFYCNSCDDHTHDDDGYWVQDTHICPSCYNDEAFWCESCSEYHWRNAATRTAGGDLYCESCADSDLTSCDYCDEYYPNDDMNNVLDGRDGLSYRTACNNCASDTECCVTNSEGDLVDANTVQQCESCDAYFSANAETCPAHEVEPA